jgi:hypothetical protein
MGVNSPLVERKMAMLFAKLFTKSSGLKTFQNVVKKPVLSITSRSMSNFHATAQVRKRSYH